MLSEPGQHETDSTRVSRQQPAAVLSIKHDRRKTSIWATQELCLNWCVYPVSRGPRGIHANILCGRLWIACIYKDSDILTFTFFFW